MGLSNLPPIAARTFCPVTRGDPWEDIVKSLKVATVGPLNAKEAVFSGLTPPHHSSPVLRRIEPYCVSLILRGGRVMVTGGGKVAERKIETLLDTGAKITVIAPELTEYIRLLGERKRLCIERRWFRGKDLEQD